MELCESECHSNEFSLSTSYFFCILFSKSKLFYEKFEFDYLLFYRCNDFFLFYVIIFLLINLTRDYDYFLAFIGPYFYIQSD